jgi:hypothetical protein
VLDSLAVRAKAFAAPQRIVEASEDVAGKAGMPSCDVQHVPQVNRKAACIALTLQLFMQCCRGDRHYDSLQLDVSTGSPLNASLSR